MAAKIFFCYAREDELLLNQLKSHLRPMQRQGLIDTWHDRDITAGTEWEREIDINLNSSQIILLLISPDFMNSDYCYGIEMKRALKRHEQGEARVIPIILRAVYWQGEPLGKLQVLPKDAKPVKSWRDQDEAFLDVAEGIYKVVEEVYRNSLSEKSRQIKEIQPDYVDQVDKKDQVVSSEPEMIKKRFHEAMINLYRETFKAINYRATQFFHMVNEHGGVETAHRLLAKDPTDGFTKLYENKRLDLSVEALVLKPEFAPLFDETELRNAYRRLESFGYNMPAIR